MEILKTEPEEADTPTVPAVAELATSHGPVPAIIAAEGPEASERFFTFFTDTIRNPNTRAAYFRNACRFIRWCEERGLTLAGPSGASTSRPTSRSSGPTHEPPSVKQHLATIRMLFDWLIVGQVVDDQPGPGRPGPEARREEGQDAGPERGRGPGPPREHQRRRTSWACGTGP